MRISDWSSDVCSSDLGAPLTPVAVFEGKVAASNLLRDTTTVPDYAGVPTAVFTIPELVRVGLLEDEAAAAGIDVDVRYKDTGEIGRASCRERVWQYV